VKRIDNSRLHREIDAERHRECYSLLGLGILVFFFCLLFAWQHFQCVRYGYQIQELKGQEAVLEECNRQLRLEEASLADPQRIDAYARHTLGLAPPAPQQVIHVVPALSVPLSEPVLARIMPVGPDGRAGFGRGEGDLRREP
jgi:cell division protein FtsL